MKSGAISLGRDCECGTRCCDEPYLANPITVFRNTIKQSPKSRESEWFYLNENMFLKPFFISCSDRMFLLSSAEKS